MALLGLSKVKFMRVESVFWGVSYPNGNWRSGNRRAQLPLAFLCPKWEAKVEKGTFIVQLSWIFTGNFTRKCSRCSHTHKKAGPSKIRLPKSPRNSFPLKGRQTWSAVCNQMEQEIWVGTRKSWIQDIFHVCSDVSVHRVMQSSFFWLEATEFSHWALVLQLRFVWKRLKSIHQLT